MSTPKAARGETAGSTSYFCKPVLGGGAWPISCFSKAMSNPSWKGKLDQ